MSKAETGKTLPNREEDSRNKASIPYIVSNWRDNSE
jgi:hypothetical protein